LTTSGQPIVRIEGGIKRFGDNVVLDHVDLAVSRGETVALIGASGSGKTTLLRSFNCLELLDGGSMWLDGTLVSQMDKRGKPVSPDGALLRRVRQRVGMVFQAFNLFPHMTALRNIATPLERVQRLPSRAAEAKAMAMLERVGLSEKANAYPGQLSGGQQQRVAIARALVMEPEVLLCDEVTSALDPEMTGEVLGVLKDLVATGMTMLIATHEMQFAAEVADRVVVMDAGRIIESGSPRTVFGQPREARTIQFLARVLDRGGLFLDDGQVVKYTGGSEVGPQHLEAHSDS
jgi:polar amino acid transport system ATP-binding protein